MKTKFNKTFFFIFIQLIIVLLIFEVGFRLAAFLKDRVLMPKQAISKEAFTILCVGDSTTEGLGVSTELSYPVCLQRFLDQNVPERKFKVINIGKGGMNSSQVLNRFKNNLEKYRPNLVLLLVGINDSWNMNESNIWMFDKSSSINKVKLNLDLALSRLKVYQFAKLLILSKANLTLSELGQKERIYAKSFERSKEKTEMLLELLKHNLKEIVNLAGGNGIRIFVLTYQKEGIGNIRRLINLAYKELEVPVVDNQALFESAVMRNLTLISKDNFHPNALGYSLIAKNIFNAMVDKEIIKSERLKYF